MDKEQARNLIKDTFENPFDKERFVGFVKNLLNTIEDASFSYKGNLIPDAYEQYISSLERIGKYTDGKHKIDILLEVKDRKSKGTYYTPREIVHYMCQQSLINYLFTECNTPCIPSLLTGEGKGEG
jgi:type I restriction-modification system DNA methylase subunit